MEPDAQDEAYLMRVPSNFYAKQFAEQGHFVPVGTQLTLRVIQLTLPTGATEILVTNATGSLGGVSEFRPRAYRGSGRNPEPRRAGFMSSPLWSHGHGDQSVAADRRELQLVEALVPGPLAAIPGARVRVGRPRKFAPRSVSWTIPPLRAWML